MLPAPTFPYSGQVALSHHCCPSSMTHHLQREMIHRVAVHGLRIHSGYFTAYGYSTRRSRVREFLGGTASRIFFFWSDIPPYVPEKAQPLSHFLLTPDRPRGSCLGLISRNQYDRRSTPKAKPPHISEPRSWTTPPASATSWSPTTPSTDVMRRCGRTSSNDGPARRSPSNSDTPTTPCAR